MINCQFLFRPGTYDDEFRALDAEIAAYAESLPGFRGVEVWLSPDGTVKNASYYFDDPPRQTRCLMVGGDCHPLGVQSAAWGNA